LIAPIQHPEDCGHNQAEQQQQQQRRDEPAGHAPTATFFFSAFRHHRANCATPGAIGDGGYGFQARAFRRISCSGGHFAGNGITGDISGPPTKRLLNHLRIAVEGI
jgi:hypothetical protein